MQLDVISKQKILQNHIRRPENENAYANLEQAKKKKKRMSGLYTCSCSY